MKVTDKQRREIKGYIANHMDLIMEYKVLMRETTLDRPWNEIASFISLEDAKEFVLRTNKTPRTELKIIDGQERECFHASL